MEKRKLNRITAGFIVLVVMVLILMFSNSLRRFTSVRQCLSGVTGFGRQTPLFVAFARA